MSEQAVNEMIREAQAPVRASVRQGRAWVPLEVDGVTEWPPAEAYYVANAAYPAGTSVRLVSTDGEESYRVTLGAHRELIKAERLRILLRDPTPLTGDSGRDDVLLDLAAIRNLIRADPALEADLAEFRLMLAGQARRLGRYPSEIATLSGLPREVVDGLPSRWS